MSFDPSSIQPNLHPNVSIYIAVFQHYHRLTKLDLCTAITIKQTNKRLYIMQFNYTVWFQAHENTIIWILRIVTTYFCSIILSIFFVQATLPGVATTVYLRCKTQKSFLCLPIKVIPQMDLQKPSDCPVSKGQKTICKQLLPGPL